MEMLSKQGLSDNPNELLASLQNMMSNASNGSNNSNCNIDMDELLNLTKQ